MPRRHAPSPRRRAAGRRRRPRASGARAPRRSPTVQLVESPTPTRRGGPRSRGMRNRICDEIAHGLPRERDNSLPRRARGPFGRQACHGAPHGTRRRRHRRRGTRSWPGRRSRPARRPGTNTSPAQRAARLARGGPGGRARRRRARARRPRRPRSLRSRVSTLPRSSRDLEVRPRGEQLRAAPQRAGPDAGALAHRVQASARRPARRSGSARRGADDELRPGRQLAGDVLGRVHREVDVARQQRALQRAGPARLVAARAVDVAGGGDLDELASARRARSRRRAPGRARAGCRASRSAAGRSTRPQRADLGGRGLRARRPRPAALSSPNSSRSSCSRAWRCSASRPFTRVGRLVQQPVHDRAGEHLDALAVALGEALPAPGVLGQQAVDHRVAARAQRGQRRQHLERAEPAARRSGSPPRRCPRRAAPRRAARTCACRPCAGARPCRAR